MICIDNEVLQETGMIITITVIRILTIIYYHHVTLDALTIIYQANKYLIPGANYGATLITRDCLNNALDFKIALL